jgi:hypothetical protein
MADHTIGNTTSSQNVSVVLHTESVIIRDDQALSDNEDPGCSDGVSHHSIPCRYLSGRICAVASSVQHRFVVIGLCRAPEPLAADQFGVVLAQVVNPVALSQCTLHLP